MNPVNRFLRSADAAYIQTHTGTRFYPEAPAPDEIHIEDIAHALSHICRFNGHTKSFYSVAQHSLHVSLHVPPADALAGLLHDAAEAYIADVSRPVKSLPALREYKHLEAHLMRTIAMKFGFAYPLPDSVREADERMLFTEKRDLLRVDLDWGYAVEPYAEIIVPTSPLVAKGDFLYRFHYLTDQL